jgi:hypothetical protein
MRFSDITHKTFLSPFPFSRLAKAPLPFRPPSVVPPDDIDPKEEKKGKRLREQLRDARMKRKYAEIGEISLARQKAIMDIAHQIYNLHQKAWAAASNPNLKQAKSLLSSSRGKIFMEPINEYDFKYKDKPITPERLKMKILGQRWPIFWNALLHNMWQSPQFDPFNHQDAPLRMFRRTGSKDPKTMTPAELVEEWHDISDSMYSEHKNLQDVIDKYGLLSGEDSQKHKELMREAMEWFKPHDSASQPQSGTDDQRKIEAWPREWGPRDAPHFDPATGRRYQSWEGRPSRTFSGNVPETPSAPAAPAPATPSAPATPPASTTPSAPAAPSWRDHLAEWHRQQGTGEVRRSLNPLFFECAKDYEGLAKAKTAAWQRAEGKNPKGGLNAKGRASAKAEGHNLKPPVLHAGNSLAKMKRQYSFLSRMSGNPGPEYDENGKPTRLLLSLRVWGASSKAAAKKKAASLKRRIEAMENR